MAVTKSAKTDHVHDHVNVHVYVNVDVDVVVDGSCLAEILSRRARSFSSGVQMNTDPYY